MQAALRGVLLTPILSTVRYSQALLPIQPIPLLRVFSMMVMKYLFRSLPEQGEPVVLLLPAQQFGSIASMPPIP